ncbi:MAG: S-adenosyl-l-methionine hydroxide adenosyltransferase family protein [Actinomycetota bacterium]
MSLPISFLSDFGYRDEFVGVVHGVLATLAPDSRVVDVTHSVPRGDVRAGALALTRSIQYLPRGVVLAVVDPGVGTDRKAIAAETEWGFFVGPDNGLLSPAVALMGGAGRIVAIENEEARIPSDGETFHGRDVFGPAAALLASGEAPLEELGPELGSDQVVPLLLPLPETKNGTVTGEAWWIDTFGNVQTNISPSDLAGVGLAPGMTATVKIGAHLHQLRWVTAYGDVGEGEALLHVDSSGLVALAVRAGRADEGLGLGEGTPVSVVGSTEGG